MKKLILYLSVTGNTEKIAQEIAGRMEDTELLSIPLKSKIPHNKFWLMLKFGYLMGGKGRFKYISPPVDMSVYDQIIVGTPIWMGRAAPPLIEVINQYGIAHKVIGAFATCGQESEDVFLDINKRTSIKSLEHTLLISEDDMNNRDSVQGKIEDFVNAIRTGIISIV
jgi:flavodoxin